LELQDVIGALALKDERDPSQLIEAVGQAPLSAG
jgi:hypothetical protein